jgi:hypothetical protein
VTILIYSAFVGAQLLLAWTFYELGKEVGAHAEAPAEARDLAPHTQHKDTR